MRWLIAALVVAINFLIIPGTDVARNAGAAICAVGLVAGSITIITHNHGRVLIMLASPVLAVIAISCSNYLAGWSEYRVLYLVSFAMLVYAVAMLKDIKPVFIAIVFMAMVNIAQRYLELVPWVERFADVDSIWGIFRQRIRYSAIIFAAIISAIYMIEQTRSKKVKAVFVIIIAALVCAAAHAYSNTILACIAITAAVYAAVLFGYWAGIAVVVASVVAVFVLKDYGFSIDSLRSMYWSVAAHEIAKAPILGHGLDSWQLYANSIGLNNLGHPHNEALAIAFDVGIPGLFVAAMAWIAFAVFAVGSTPVLIGVVLIPLSTMTNSARYPEIYMLIALFFGAAISTCRRMMYSD